MTQEISGTSDQNVQLVSSRAAVAKATRGDDGVEMFNLKNIFDKY